MAGKSYVVTGVREIDSKLASFEPKVGKKMARGSMRRIVKATVLADAKANAPVDEGNLEAALKLVAMKRSRSRIGVVVRTKLGGVDYGAALEFGSKTHRADPFLRPAGYGNEKRIRGMIIDEIREEIRKMHKAVK